MNTDWNGNIGGNWTFCPSTIPAYSVKIQAPAFGCL